MNDYDLDRARRKHQTHPVLGPAVQTLTYLMTWTDNNGDAWACRLLPTAGRAEAVRLHRDVPELHHRGLQADDA